MLRRVLKTADTKTRQVAYNTLVRAVLEYGYTKKNIKKIEKAQNRTLKFIFHIKGKVSFTKLRKATYILSLAEVLASLNHRILHQKNAMIPDNLLIFLTLQ